MLLTANCSVAAAAAGSPDFKLHDAFTILEIAESEHAGFFEKGEGAKALNVRLYGRAGGVAPAGETLTTDIRLQGAAGVRLQVVNAKGKPVPFAQVDLRTESLLDQAQEAEHEGVDRGDEGVGENRIDLVQGPVDQTAGRGAEDGADETRGHAHEPQEDAQDQPAGRPGRACWR